MNSKKNMLKDSYSNYLNSLNIKSDKRTGISDFLYNQVIMDKFQKEKKNLRYKKGKSWDYKFKLL